MKIQKLLFSCLIILYSCKKDKASMPAVLAPAQPSMTYLDLKDTAVGFNRAVILDIDKDGATDIYFTTLLVGDPVMQQDKMQWLLTGGFDTNFPVNANESIPVLGLNDAITVKDPPGYNWYNASAVVLVQKIISVAAPPVWAGDWKKVSHRYIPFQLIKATGVYNGWIEVSFSTGNEKLVLHKTAVCKEQNKDIKAGN